MKVVWSRDFFLISDIEFCNETGAVRLTHGSSTRIGRLEVCSNGHWGSVCSIGTTNATARVVCRELGHVARGTFMHNNYNYIKYSINILFMIMSGIFINL